MTEASGILRFFLPIVAYLLGSIPTALIMSKRLKGVDIRTIGNGNMGAQNTFHMLGEKPAVIVVVVDFLKGALPVFLSQLLGLSLGWQFLTGVCAILGHDFPVFAGFRGGQGTATSLGTMLVLFPTETLLGLILYGILFLIIRKSPLTAGIGGGLIALLLALSQKWVLLAYAVGVFIFIPFKMFIDSPRRKVIETVRIKQNGIEKKSSR